MSVHVTSWVLKNSPAAHGARLVLIVLADHANEDGTGAYPSIATIASEARLSENAVRAALKRLQKDHAIRHEGYSVFKTKVWRVLMTPSDSAPPESAPLQNGSEIAQFHPSGCTQTEVKPSLNPSSQLLSLKPGNVKNANETPAGSDRTTSAVIELLTTKAPRLNVDPAAIASLVAAHSPEDLFRATEQLIEKQAHYDKGEDAATALQFRLPRRRREAA